MRKPNKPTNKLPESFGGLKENFSTDKIENGYEPDTPDILGGANLNYLLDTNGDNNRYFNAICDFIADMPFAKTITVDSNNNLIYRDWLGGRNFGELVYSSVPLSDSGLKLLDGSLIQGTGIYKNFVDYMASIVSTYPSIFTTEANWQATVTQYGTCGKYVYNSTNNTIRIPKVTGIIEGTVDVNALGNIVSAGLPQHSHTATLQNAGGHNHNRGDMNITGYFETRFREYTNGLVGYCGGAISTRAGLNAEERGAGGAEWVNNGSNFNFDASRSWTGNTSWNGDHTHSTTISNATNNLYKTGINTVQPQTVKMFVYVVVANGINKTDVEIDIDEITADLNYKADIDLSNATENISTSAKDFFTGLALPSDRYIDLPLGESGSHYTAPADGYILCIKESTGENYQAVILGSEDTLLSTDIGSSLAIWLRCWLPVTKGSTFYVNYSAAGATRVFRFIYAQGAESEV